MRLPFFAAVSDTRRSRIVVVLDRGSSPSTWTVTCARWGKGRGRRRCCPSWVATVAWGTQIPTAGDRTCSRTPRRGRPPALKAWQRGAADVAGRRPARGRRGVRNRWRLGNWPGPPRIVTGGSKGRGQGPSRTPSAARGVPLLGAFEPGTATPLEGRPTPGCANGHRPITAPAANCLAATCMGRTDPIRGGDFVAAPRPWP